MRRVAAALAALAVLAVLVPSLVLGGIVAGLSPAHWSGTKVVELEVALLLTRSPGPMPEAAAMLLSRADRQDESDVGDLAPSWWDASAGEVVLGAVTPVGEAIRRSLSAPGVATRIERRLLSASQLRALQEAVTDGLQAAHIEGAYMIEVDAERNQVMLSVTSLSHDGLATVARRHGDAVVIRWSPLTPPAYNNGPPPDPPTLWDTARPVTTWFTLATGFPWYLATGLLLTAAGWWGLLRARRRRSTPAPVGGKDAVS